jgi:hypothetical protein
MLNFKQKVMYLPFAGLGGDLPLRGQVALVANLWPML